MQEGTAAGPSSILGCSPGQELQFVQKFANGLSLMNMSPRPSGWDVPDRVLRESACCIRGLQSPAAASRLG